MWVLQNTITNDFFAGWSSEDIVQTTKNKEIAHVYILWSDAAQDRAILTKNWVMKLKEDT